MYSFLLFVHLLICFALVAVVLMQSGKGGGLAGGAFGGSAQTVFGGRGANDFITRATMALGVAFFVTSVSLALMSSTTGRSRKSLIQEEARKASSSAPAQLPGRSPSAIPGASNPLPVGTAPATTNPQAAPAKPPAGTSGVKH